ncbi:MAG TPA: DinB family protein [Chitinophagaceae bacterium]
MQLNEYLIETFKYNDSTNKKLLGKIKMLTNPEESIKLFSHLINSQYKWMARITQDPGAKTMSWWDPVYDFDKLEEEWIKSLDLWIKYIDSMTEEELSVEKTFTGFDGTIWAATPKDIALQLNYHSIHHRAQIQTLIRQQGIEPDFVDYIGTKYRKLS